jgi:hypothetical protein
MTVQAAPVVSFSEDLNGGINAVLHLNADAVRNRFFSNLTGVGTETFESYAVNSSTWLDIAFPDTGMAVLSGDHGLRVCGMRQQPAVCRQELDDLAQDHRANLPQPKVALDRWYDLSTASSTALSPQSVDILRGGIPLQPRARSAT